VFQIQAFLSDRSSDSYWRYEACTGSLWNSQYSDDPPTMKDYLAPDVYSVLHITCDPSRARLSGGGLPLVHRDSVIVRAHPLVSTLNSHQSFKLHLVNVISTTPSLTVANVYCPPQTLLWFYKKLVDMLSAVISMTDHLLHLCPSAPASRSRFRLQHDWFVEPTPSSSSPTVGHFSSANRRLMVSLIISKQQWPLY